MKLTTTIIAAALLLPLIACNETTTGFTCETVCTEDTTQSTRHWETLPVSVAIQTDADLTAMTIYNETLGREIFVEASSVETADIVIGMRSPETATNGTTHFNTFDNVMTDAAVYIDSDIDVDSLLYQKVVAHELGHAIGADHFCGCVMQPCAELIDDDIASEIDTPIFLEWFDANY